MDDSNIKPNNAADNRQPNGTFGPGNNANPAGRPKGQTLKEYQAEQFRQMSPEEKAEWLKDVPKSEKWRMSEGNPATKLQGDSEAPFVLVVKDINGNSITKRLSAEELPDESTGSSATI